MDTAPVETEDPLQRYAAKRNFSLTPEPNAERKRSDAAHPLGFVIQKHWASRLHYDFRLELDGVLLSWAVPKGPSFDPADKRMAVHVEDHPVDYGGFEGTIPPRQYGAGQVIVWDRGTWTPLADPRDGLAKGKLPFELHGEKLAGAWELIRISGRNGKSEKQDAWLLFKKRDAWSRAAADYDVTLALPDSVVAQPLGPVEARQAPDGSPLAGAGAPGQPVGTKRAAKTGEGAATQPVAKVSPRAGSARSAAAGSVAAGELSAATGAPRIKLGRLKGAVKAPLPASLAPQLATLAKAPPTSGDWVCEVKFDGYRLLARIERGRARLYTRQGNDWSDKLPTVVADVESLGIDSGWLDGEIVVLNATGTPDFNALQNAFDAARTERIDYFVFDVPFLDGHDLRALPLRERRAVLAQRLAPHASGPVRFSAEFDADPASLLQSACEMRLEGIIAKRADAPYTSRRSDSWLKLKCSLRQEFVVIGYTDRANSTREIGGLLLGYHDDAGHLQHAGNVGTGWDATTAAELHRKLSALRIEASPLGEAVKPGRWSRRAPGGERWVRPELVAEVQFGEWTPDGRIRHASFQGLRTDKPAAQVTREHAAVAVNAMRPATESAMTASLETSTEPPRAAAKKAAKASAAAARVAAPLAKAKAKARAKAEATATVTAPAVTIAPARSARKSGAVRAGRITVSNADRVIDASTGLTKLDLVRYYESVAERLLPHLKGRAVSLVRGPGGVGGALFFQKHDDKLSIPGLREIDPALWPGHAALLEVPSAEAIVAAAQMNVIEFHTWNSTVRHFDAPDRVVFDLDPGEGVAWPKVREAAMLTHALLDEIGLKSWLKTSGGKGLHVVVPITPKLDCDTVKAFSQAVVQHLAATIPSRFVAKSGPANRVGKVYVDYLRNGHGATTAAAFSARARPGLGVSVPVPWDALPELKGNAQWTIATVRDHLSFETADPWADYARSRQTLTRAMKAIGFRPGA